MTIDELEQIFIDKGHRGFFYQNKLRFSVELHPNQYDKETIKTAINLWKAAKKEYQTYKRFKRYVIISKNHFEKIKKI